MHACVRHSQAFLKCRCIDGKCVFKHFVVHVQRQALPHRNSSPQIALHALQYYELGLEFRPDCYHIPTAWLLTYSGYTWMALSCSAMLGARLTLGPAVSLCRRCTCPRLHPLQLLTLAQLCKLVRSHWYLLSRWCIAAG